MLVLVVCAMQDTTATTPGFAYRVHGVVYGRPSMKVFL